MAEKRSQSNLMIGRAEGLGMPSAELYYRARKDYETDLTHRAIRVFRFISHYDRAPRLDEITAYLGSAPNTASELIKRLQNKGLVVRNRAKRDERTIEIELTEAGKVALTKHSTLDPRKLRDGFTELDDFEQDVLVKSIRKITEAID